MTVDVEPVTYDGAHGRAGWTHHGCRCTVCHRAMRDYSRLRNALAAYRAGRDVQTRVPSGRARRHVERLVAAGWTRTSIAAAAGIAPRTMWRILDGRRVSLVTERRILAVAG